ncbi:MAG: alpha/beta fold hydrolase [Actinomycetota bacterium]
MRARYPDADGFVDRNGTKIAYEVFGEGDRTLLILPTWSIVHSRYWKLQVPYFARYARVITFDPRGNGRSDRPEGPEAYAPAEFAADAIAVLDTVGVARASVLSLSVAARAAITLAAGHPDRVEALAFLGPFVKLEEPDEARSRGWEQDFEGFLEAFFTINFPEPHSSKVFEDAMTWAHETTPQVLTDSRIGGTIGFDPAHARELCAQIRCPVLVIEGSDDMVTPPPMARALAEATRGRLVLLEGTGHSPHTREPVKTNLLLRDFFGLRPLSVEPRRWNRRPKRAIFVSSPIGLGHAQRDVAIADELRARHQDLEIDWLAQAPVTQVLEARGERIHPGSRFLASEVDHIDSESGEHDLHVFQTWRNMDEIMLANFMVFHDIVESEHYDLWIGDEAWELDHFLHENPELKRAPFVWLTDFVGWLPMPDGGEREARLTADYNAEMIEHIDRYPRLRDRSIFVGRPEDVVPDAFGAGLPSIRAWTEQHYDFSGYVTGFDPAAFADRAALRAELGYAPDEKICLVTVGGSGVGAHLLRRVIASYAEAKRSVAALRMIVVAGPRIDPTSLEAPDGVELRAFVPGLYRHLAACDLAVVQGGLTTCMELTANRRPFLSFPLRHHFEQNFHVPHRLTRYRAGPALDFDASPPELIAHAIAVEIDRTPDYLPVETDGAARAAAMIAEFL